MLTETPQPVDYLAEAEKCDDAARRATLSEVRTAYASLADQWRDLARQAEEFGIPGPG